MQGLDYQNGELCDIQVRLMELENMQGLDYQLDLMHLDTSRKTWKGGGISNVFFLHMVLAFFGFPYALNWRISFIRW